MSETRFFDPANPPEWTTPEWYAGIERAPHLEQPEHRHRIEVAAAYVQRACRDLGATTVSDLGAGDGGLLSLLEIDGYLGDAWGYDLIEANVRGAVQRGVEVVLADAFDEDHPSVVYGDCCVLTEVIEHLLDPHGTLAWLLHRTDFIVASSPNDETWESRYEFHTWGWDMDGYRALFEGAGWRVARHEAIPGFQVLLAQR